MNEINQKNDNENKPSEKESYELPAKLKKKYLVMDGKFYDKDHPEKAHFEDKGKSLSTDRDDREIVIAMIAVAKAKGWSEIEIKGSELFQRYALIESERLGLRVTRHNVKETEKEPNKIALEKTAPIEKDREHHKKNQRHVSEYIGVLVDHGKAPYNFDLNETKSYFVKYRTENQTEKIQWGTDLERAINESQAQKGQKISLERQEKQPVTPQNTQDKNGNMLEQEARLFRTVWQVNVLDQAINADVQKKEKENEPEDVAIIAARKVLQEAIKQQPPEKQKVIMQKFDEKIKSYTDRGMPLPLSAPIIRTQEKVIMDMTPQQNIDKER
ncbi:MAG: LPD7 domain-containing protein [Pseudomonadota bacterium]